jgi:hypothetical protein
MKSSCSSFKLMNLLLKKDGTAWRSIYSRQPCHGGLSLSRSLDLVGTSAAALLRYRVQERVRRIVQGRGQAGQPHGQPTDQERGSPCRADLGMRRRAPVGSRADSFQVRARGYGCSSGIVVDVVSWALLKAKAKDCTRARMTCKYDILGGLATPYKRASMGMISCSNDLCPPRSQRRIAGHMIASPLLANHRLSTQAIGTA